MGIFDAFTGAPAQDAAAKNTALLQANQAAGTTTLNNGQTSAIGALGQAAGVYQPLQAKYGAATTLGLDALGANGPAGNDAATAAFRASPGYQYNVDQSEQGVLRNAAATGAVAGGNTLAALSDRAGNLADQGYNSWLTNLNSYVSPELQAAGGVANADTNQAGVYQNTASNIANLGTTTATGIAGQNTQAANADMAASGNIWGLGMNLAKLGVGAATGGTSLLGGGGGTVANGGIVLGGAGGPGQFLKAA